jgi:serine/threonine protein kinase
MTPLGVSSANTPDTVADTSLSATRALAPGALILDGRFRVERLLGGGGMGLIYLAEQVSLGRMVAVKVLRNDLPLDAHMGERFRREALLLSSVEHPAVVRVIDFGHTDVGPCLVMDLVEGETLETLLSRHGALAPDRAERILTQLAQGLAAIHAKGIVHRDLKPENVVLVRGPDMTEQARLLDFGIAKLAESGEAPSVTQAGYVLGTPEYLAPEQALGQQVDARSDLYSLGVIAFRVLTGRHPFPGPSAREFVSQHIHQEPPALLALRPDLTTHGPLVAAVMACLSKDPMFRPQSALEFLGRLKAIDGPVTFSVGMRLGDELPTVETPMGKSSLSRGRKGLMVTFGLALVAGAVLAAIWFNQPMRKARRLIDGNRGSEALQVIDDVMNGSKEAAASGQWRMLRAAALTQSSKLEEAWKLLEAIPETEDVEAVTLEAMADGFGRGEPARLRKLLARFPKAKTLPSLQKLANGEASFAQWGALRFIDIEYAGQGLALGKLYMSALERKDCTTRRVAARRLGELRTVESVEALQRVKAQPRKRTVFTDDECGQDAATAALRALEKE